jgi:aspartyl aminopeptidase
MDINKEYPTQTLDYSRQNAWERMSDQEKASVMGFCEDYKNYLNTGKTEREAVEVTVAQLRSAGFLPLGGCVQLKAGDKIYAVNRQKALIAAVIGSQSLETGLNLVGAHVDSPRLDLKPQPLFEEDGFALFKTHYYGGIKKYQWLSLPLALHGVVIKGDGTAVSVVIGELPGDPVFTITDLLPHLAKDQM